jgi:hypothetical protein
MSKNVLLGGLLPFISSPVALAVAVGLVIYNMLPDEEDDQDNGSDAVPDGPAPSHEPLGIDVLTVVETALEPQETVETTVAETVGSTVQNSNSRRPTDEGNAASNLVETINDEDLKKEMIRQAMSELGKCSAAARAKRRQGE